MEVSHKIKLTNKQLADTFIDNVDFELLAKIYSNEEKKQIEFLEDINYIMNVLMSLNLVGNNCEYEPNFKVLKKQKRR